MKLISQIEKFDYKCTSGVHRVSVPTPACKDAHSLCDLKTLQNEHVCQTAEHSIGGGGTAAYSAAST
jgi:hypothetical protein